MSAREHIGDPRFERLQLRILELEKRLGAIPFADGALIEDEAVATTATRVSHRLGRAPNGVIVMKASPDAALGFSASQPSDTHLAVHLEASAAATFTLWFW